MPTVARLHPLAPLEATPTAITARSGASAAIERRGEGEVITVRDASAQLVFELDAATGKAILSVPDGDLAIQAAGDVEIRAGGAVRCQAGQGDTSSSLLLDGGSATLSSQALELAAKQAHVAFEEARYRGKRLAAKLGEAKATIDRLETISERIFERARSVFRTTDDLHQLKAGRVRTLVDEGYSLRSGHASIEAEREMKLDGNTIHLG